MPPNSGPIDSLIILKQPPPFGTPFVAMALIDRDVRREAEQPRRTTAIPPPIPACPVILGRRRNRIIPRMFWTVGTKTPIIVPSFVDPPSRTCSSIRFSLLSIFSPSHDKLSFKDVLRGCTPGAWSGATPSSIESPWITSSIDEEVAQSEGCCFHHRKNEKEKLAQGGCWWDYI